MRAQSIFGLVGHMLESQLTKVSSPFFFPLDVQCCDDLSCPPVEGATTVGRAADLCESNTLLRCVGDINNKKRVCRKYLDLRDRKMEKKTHSANKQTSQPASKQANNQPTKQANKQTNKQADNKQTTKQAHKNR